MAAAAVPVPRQEADRKAVKFCEHYIVGGSAPRRRNPLPTHILQGRMS